MRPCAEAEWSKATVPQSRRTVWRCTSPAQTTKTTYLRKARLDRRGKTVHLMMTPSGQKSIQKLSIYACYTKNSDATSPRWSFGKPGFSVRLTNRVFSSDRRARHRRADNTESWHRCPNANTLQPECPADLRFHSGIRRVHSLGRDVAASQLCNFPNDHHHGGIEFSGWVWASAGSHTGNHFVLVGRKPTNI